MEKVYYAIDPGDKGAIAEYDAGWVNTKELSIDNLCMLTFMQSSDITMTLVIEDVRWLPHDTPATAWGLAKTVGWIEAIFYSRPANIEIHYVKPEKWQAKMYKGISRDQSKSEILTDAFRKHFPDMRYVPVYAYAACLMAKYASLID